MAVSIGWYLLTKFWVYIVCPDIWFRSRAIPMNAWFSVSSTPWNAGSYCKSWNKWQASWNPFIWCSWGWVCFLSVLCYCMLEWPGKSSELYRVRRLADWKDELETFPIHPTRACSSGMLSGFSVSWLLSINDHHHGDINPSLLDHHVIKGSFGGLDPPVSESVWTCSCAEGLTTSLP